MHRRHIIHFIKKYMAVPAYSSWLPWLQDHVHVSVIWKYDEIDGRRLHHGIQKLSYIHCQSNVSVCYVSMAADFVYQRCSDLSFFLSCRYPTDQWIQLRGNRDLDIKGWYVPPCRVADTTLSCQSQSISICFVKPLSVMLYLSVSTM